MHKIVPSIPARILAGAAMSLLAFATACSYSKGAEPSPLPTPCTDSQAITYSGVISPIFDANCRSCHGSSVYKQLGGNNDYGTYQSIKNQSASLILGCIQHEAGYNPMPKGGAKIAACDIAKIKTWIEAGQPNN